MDATHLSALTISTKETPKTDECSLCFAEFHGRDVASVERDPKCQTHCGHLFHLDCLTRQFLYQPIGLRSCGYCRQKPFPVLNMKTGESYPDKFFPDETFYNACLRGDLDQVKKSLAEEVYVNAVMEDGLTALMMASGRGHTDIAEHLINQGADVNAVRAESDATPLFFAAQNNNTDIVELLISKGANVASSRTKDGATPLSIAVQGGFTDCVKLLLNAGADPNTALSNGVTPLYVAAFRGYNECVQLLLEKEVDLETRTQIGVTPLFAASARGNKECEEILINAGANINAARASDDSPLAVATRLGCTTWEEFFTKIEASRGTEERLWLSS